MTNQADRWVLARRGILSVLGLVLFVGFLALGTWQLQRRAWKLDLIERVDQRVHGEPGPLPSRADWSAVTAAAHEYLPVHLEGRWEKRKTRLVQALSELGSGFWVMTPLVRADGSSVWVNRGFVPQDQRDRWLGNAPASTSDEGVVSIEGLLRISEPKGGFLRPNDSTQGRWYSRDVSALSLSAGVKQAAPFFVDAGLPGQVQVGSPDVWPRPGLTVIRFSNSHLMYALTWYGLALMVLWGAWTVASYERSRAKRARSTPATNVHAPSSR